MTFDPRLALTFAVVTEEMSFTRAAERLGVAQPWVSEQIRRLEERLKRQLLVRTSRRVELTDEGRAFLPYAQALARANESAQRWASEMRTARRPVLRVGAVDILTAYPERNILIDRFMHAYPDVDLRIHGGTADELQSRLIAGEVDLVLAFGTSAADYPEIQVATTLCRRYGGLMIPREDPLADREAVGLTDVNARVFVTSPGRSDPVALRSTYATLTGNGAELFPAPEANRTTIENLARARRWSCLRWTVEPEPRHVQGDMVCVPIAGNPLVLEPALLRSSRAPRTELAERLITIAAALYAEASEPGLKGPFG